MLFWFTIIVIDNEDNTDISKASTVAVDDVNLANNINSHEEAVDISKSHEVKNRKLYLGGYRNKLTGVIYYHAATQTVKPPWKNYRTSERFSR